MWICGSSAACRTAVAAWALSGRSLGFADWSTYAKRFSPPGCSIDFIRSFQRRARRERQGTQEKDRLDLNTLRITGAATEVHRRWGPGLWGRLTTCLGYELRQIGFKLSSRSHCRSFTNT